MSTLLCHHCRTAVPEGLFNQPEALPCPRCQTLLLVRVFPAFFRAPATGQAAEAVTSAEDASCFYHPRKKAVVPCADCGRFLCALCDLEIGRRHLCPACAVGGGPGAGGHQPGPGQPGLPVGRIEPRRILHDNVALSLAVLPLVLWPFTLFTAPVALYLALRYWNEPRRNPLGRTRVRLVFAALLSTATLAGWGLLFYYLFTHGF